MAVEVMKRRKESGGGGFLGALGTLAGGIGGFALGGPAGAALGAQLGGAAGGVAGAVASNGGGGGGSVPVNTDTAMQRRLAASSSDSLTQLREAQSALAQLPDPNLRKQYAAPLVQAEQALMKRGIA